ncbi:MAG: YitT family protein [Rikenellaceae bacterium]
MKAELTITPTKIFTTLKEYFLMTVGMLCYAFGWIGCILPAGGVGGGASGLSIILCAACEKYWGLSIEIGTMVFIINAVLILIAGNIVGWKFGIKSIYCIVILSVLMNTLQALLEGVVLFELESILMVALGAIISGIGVALCFKQGGSTGGVDIVAMIINHYRTVSYGKIVIYLDFTIIASSLLIGMGIEAVIYGYLLTAIFGYTVDILMSGSQQSSQIFIISKDPQAMADAIMLSSHRGITLIDSQGWYTKESSKIVMVVCRKRESGNILSVVRSVDPTAFITVGSVMGVYGQGFEELRKI